MKTIWKFNLELYDTQAIEIPIGARPLTVQMQNGELCLWAIVDSTAEKTRCYVHIIGTGNPVPPNVDEYRYINTVQDGAFVWHVFVDA